LKNIKLSVCLVVKNEEKYLPRCLSSIKYVADEIILVDTGSTDRTVEIAREYTDRVFEIRWRDDFSKARNFALDKASGEWILVLDGDEELDSQCVNALRKKIRQDGTEGYLIKVLNYYEAGSGVEIAPDVVFRLFKNKKGYRYSGLIHEQICDNIITTNPNAKIEIAEDICIIHYGYLNEEITAKNKSGRNTRLLQKAVQKDPENLLNRFHLGVEYFRNNRLGDALCEFLFVFDKASKQAVYTPKLMRYITQCYYLLADFEGALNFIDNYWLKYSKDHGDLYYLKGMVCRSLGQNAEAYRAFKECLSVPPQPAHYANLYCQYKDKIYHQLGELAEYYTDYERALEYYIKALRENPRSIHSLARIIHILKPQENADYTITALNSVFDLSDPGIQLDLGHLFFQEQAYRLAIECFESAAAQVPVTAQAHLVKGLCLLRTKQYLPAIRELNLIPPGNDFYATAQGNLFLYYWLKRQNKKAAACLKNIKNAGANPTLAEVLEILHKGWRATPAELKSGEEAVYPIVSEILERLIELGELASFKDAWACFEGLFKTRPTKLLGDLYYKYKMYDKAEAEYRQLLGQNTADPEIFYRLGKTCWALGNLTGAEIFLRKALEQGYNQPKVNWEIARLYQDLAVKTLEEGLQKYPGNQEFLNLLEKIKANLIEV